MSDWSDRQITLYRDLLDRSRYMPWRELAAECISGCRFERPLSPAEIAAEEQRLGVALPDELRAFYTSSAALYDSTGANIVMSLDELVNENLDLWSGSYDDTYMPFDGVVVFGCPGNGDRFFFPRLRSGEYGRGVFLWDHENDSRTWLANGLKDFLIRAKTNKTG